MQASFIPPPRKHEERMKKIAAGATLAAAVGFSALSATPAMAAPFVFDNCSQAASYGVYNIPAGSPGYGTHLDQPVDGVGCEKDGVAYNANLVPAGDVVADPVPPAVEGPQVDQVPVGGADAGVTPESTNDMGALAVGGGLALMAAAGGTYVVRRRNAQV